MPGTMKMDAPIMSKQTTQGNMMDPMMNMNQQMVGSIAEPTVQPQNPLPEETNTGGGEELDGEFL